MKLFLHCFVLVLFLCPILAFSYDLPLELLIEVNEELEDQLRFDSIFKSTLENEFIEIISIRPLFYEPQEDSKRVSWDQLQMGRWFRVMGPRKSLYSIQQQMNDVKGVLSVEAVFPHYTNLEPNDMNNYDMWGLVNMNLPEAWDIHQAESEILIAVLDSGCKLDHPDLESNIFVNPGEDLNQNGIWDETDNDSIDNDENGFIDDICGWDFVEYVLEEWDDPAEGEDYGPPDNMVYPDILSHGTHVAGSAAGVTNNNEGIAAASWNCKLLPLRCAYAVEDGERLMGLGPPLDFIAAIQYAVDMGANIINISYGGGFYQPYQDAVTYARNNNCLVFTSGGNGNTNEIQFPAGFVGATAVAAIDVNYEKASFSNYGDYISLAAPGVNIWSTMPHSPYDPVDYESYNGTSMASPNAASVAAYVWSLNPSFTDDQVLEIISQTCRSIDAENPGYEGDFGAGFVDAEAAIQLALEMTIPTPQFVGFTLDEETGVVELDWTLNDQGRDDFMGFNLYLNDEFLVSPEDTFYTHQLAEFGDFSFSITAMFGEDESNPDYINIFWNPYFGFPFFSGFEEGMEGWYTINDGVTLITDPVLAGANALSIEDPDTTSTVLHYFEPQENLVVEVYAQTQSHPDMFEGFAQGIVLNGDNDDNRLAVYYDALSRVVLDYNDTTHAFELFQYPIYGSDWLKTRIYFNNGNLFISVANSDFDIIETLAHQVEDILVSSAGLIVNQTHSPSIYDNFNVNDNDLDHFQPVEPTLNGYPIVFSVNPDILEVFDIAEVAMFDGELCVGAVEFNSDPFTELVTWGQSDEQSGFIAGNPIILKGYSEDENREVFLPLEYITIGDGTFGFETFTKLHIGEGSSSTPENEELIPEKFEVGSAYPNPFNPSVSVPISMPEAGSIEISVFNLLGQEVYHDTRNLNAGINQITFDANSSTATLPNGMYFFGVSFGTQQTIQKIILMK